VTGGERRNGQKEKITRKFWGGVSVCTVETNTLLNKVRNGKSKKKKIELVIVSGGRNRDGGDKTPNGVKDGK